jgi:two-component system, OmpR family, alkaline phosphatase synthesis response regulator PhoP
MATRILIVEDDRKTAATLRLYLEREGYSVREAHDGPEGLEAARTWRPDAVLLDLMLPGMDGREICRVLRRDSQVPILMLTARATEEDRVHGLDLGADDYIPKPYSPREVVARVRAVLRRVGGTEEQRVLRFHGLEIDPERQQVLAAGRTISLTPTEFKILHLLAAAPGRVFSRAQLLEKALGHQSAGLDRTVDAHVKNLRRKIEPDRDRPAYIVTVFGVGYRFEGRADAA